jgi:hypothetical protein
MHNMTMTVQITAQRLKELLEGRCGRLEKMRVDAREHEHAAIKMNDAHRGMGQRRLADSIERTIESLKLVHTIVSESSTPSYELSLGDLKALDLFDTNVYID